MSILGQRHMPVIECILPAFEAAHKATSVGTGKLHVPCFPEWPPVITLGNVDTHVVAIRPDCRYDVLPCLGDWRNLGSPAAEGTDGAINLGLPAHGNGMQEETFDRLNGTIRRAEAPSNKEFVHHILSGPKRAALAVGIGAVDMPQGVVVAGSGALGGLDAGASTAVGTHDGRGVACTDGSWRFGRSFAAEY